MPSNHQDQGTARLSMSFLRAVPRASLEAIERLAGYMGVTPYQYPGESREVYRLRCVIAIQSAEVSRER